MTTVVLTIRGLGAHWLGCYGNEWVATPNLDKLAAEGVVYDNHFASSFSPPEPIAEATLIRAERSDGSHLHALRRLLKRRKHTANELIWIESDALEPPWHVPQELFEDYYEGEETPITTPKDGDDWDTLHASFAAAVTMLDTEIGAIIESFPAETAWIIAGTNGYPLGEHGVIGPGTLHEEAVHLPLLVRLPGHAGLRIEELTQSSDLAELVRCVALEGELPRIGPEQVITNCENQRAIRSRDWTMIVDGERCQLFHRPEDRFEMYDVSRLHPDAVEMLLAELNSH